MASDRSKSPPVAGDDHSFDHRLTDAYHRSGLAPDSGARHFVFIFGDRAYQFDFRRGDSQSLIASRLREFADQLGDDSSGNGPT